MNGKPQLSLDVLRSKLSRHQGKAYWKSLEELAETDEFNELLHREFPRQASVWESADRRQFLKLMGASLALAGLSACTKQPEERIVPYVNTPEYLVPGEPLSFATATVMDGYATGVLVTSHEGRPTKIEGNPGHPWSLGATDRFMQASILGLYDPDRSQVISRKGEIVTNDQFLRELEVAMTNQRSLKGAGLRILTGTVTSPTLADQIERLLKDFPKAVWHPYEAVNMDALREGSLLAFGQHVDTQYRFDKAEVVVALDSDFLTSGPGSVRYAREFAQRRRITGGKKDINRLYSIESTPTNTGAVADHRLPVRSAEVESLTRSLAAALGLNVSAPSTAHQDWISTLARDLRNHRGSSVVVPGTFQPASVHALAHAINAALGNIGSTVIHTEPVDAHPVNQNESLRALAQEIDKGTVDVLLILGGNPAYDAPADLEFAKRIQKVDFSVHLGLYHDETAENTTWHLPRVHSLEEWSDARAVDGTVTILQPLIAPLYRGSISPHQLLEEVAGRTSRKNHDIVQEYWKKRAGAVGFENFWRTSLNNGIVANTALPARQVRLNLAASVARPSQPGADELQSGEFEVILRPDPSIWDGQFANNGWLQELPKPLTKLTWDNAALVAPSTAEEYHVSNGDMVEIAADGRSVKAPILIVPGHPKQAVTLHLGYGRSKSGSVGSGRGFNAYALRTSQSPWSIRAARLSNADGHTDLAITQDHHSMEGRNIVRSAPISEFLTNPNFAKELGEVPSQSESLYKAFEYDGYKWAMSIDLNACTGCNACVVGCQSENNIPIVGKEQVLASREMHWIRIDRYYEGDPEDPKTYFQPVPCMHCENAPCEVVCPVDATNHDSEGLNVMVYNRCIGTRYCSNNCPYKVRRFNFLQYSAEDSPTLEMQKNPDVTVRSRGVMEKCSYCVQRISAARIEAKKEGRPIRDGEVVTACEAACPSQAIVFGDINDPSSRISAVKKEPHDYSLLADLNTRPRTTYLANIKNPNPDLEQKESHS